MSRVFRAIMKLSSFSALSVFIWLAITVAPGRAEITRLRLEHVFENLEQTFPVIILSMREIRKAEFDILSAQGAFDLALKGSAANTSGYYNNNRFVTDLEKPTSIWGTSFFAGYRYSQGNFPDYYGDRRTNPGGEVRFGGRIPLWRDRSIDQGRLELKQSEINKSIANHLLDGQKLAVYRDAAASYWNWLASGKRKRIIEGLLAIAETRKDQLRKRVALGDMPPIEEKENDRAIFARREQLTAADRVMQKSALYLSLYFREKDGKMRLPGPEQLPPEFPPEMKIPETQFSADKAFALENRPELQKILREITLEQNALKFHENQRAPQLDLILRGSRDIENASVFKRNPWEGDFALVFNIPLQTRKQDGKIGGTETKIEILRTKLNFQKDKIEIEANDALIALENALRRLEIIKQEVVLAEELARAEKTRFDLGDSTLLIVNLREQAAAEVSLRLVGAEVDYWVARADYDAVLMKNLRRS
jgi:outer membrane protein, heavy metal efflux system